MQYWLTMTSTSLDVKFFRYTQGFFISDWTTGFCAVAIIYPKGLLVISSAELMFLSYCSGGINLNSGQSLSWKVDTAIKWNYKISVFSKNSFIYPPPHLGGGHTWLFQVLWATTLNGSLWRVFSFNLLTPISWLGCQSITLCPTIKFTCSWTYF